MYLIPKNSLGLRKSPPLSYFSNLIDHCLSLKSLTLTKSIHAQLIKFGLNTHTFLGNRCLELYSRVGIVKDALKAFDDIRKKNVVSWNVCLMVFVKSDDVDRARLLFDEMPKRDVVSWNSMISCYASNGYAESAFEIFSGMQIAGIRASGYTFSILVSFVRSAYYGKQIHGSMIRNEVNLSSVVVGNSLIDMYGKVGLVEYAFGVFLTMKELDIISWNSLISGCCKSGYEEVALNQFCIMRSRGFFPDEFTVSSVVTACSNLQDLDKGKQIFSLCLKLGFLLNTIVSSAVIDLFSRCNRMDDSVRIFEEIDVWDSAVCNAMMSTYARHGLEENGLQLFVLAMRKNVWPTDFTLSCMVSCASVCFLVEQGSQLHSLVVKTGFESDSIVASSLVEMYCKYGLIDSALDIFATMGVRDLISWNTMIMGLAHNAKLVESLDLFNELLEKGPPPDLITLTVVLLACKYGGFVDQGISIISSMEKEHGVIPNDEHYACIVEMLTRAGKLKEAVDVIEAMPNEPNAVIWESILVACGVHGDLQLTERVAQRIMELEPQSSLPYLVLAEAYEMRGRWESLVRVRKGLKERNARKLVGCSWIGVQNHLFVFNSTEMLNHGGKDIYLILGLLMDDMEGEDYVYPNYDEGGEEEIPKNEGN